MVQNARHCCHVADYPAELTPSKRQTESLSPSMSYAGRKLSTIFQIYLCRTLHVSMLVVRIPSRSNSTGIIFHLIQNPT